MSLVLYLQINHLAAVIATEMRDNKEATKILLFLLYREQIASNRRPCIPTGAEAYYIYRDVIESCISNRVRLSEYAGDRSQCTTNRANYRSWLVS